ncbi:hypothetical protein IJT93_12200 [bacterium]|nr:hypothetical protein [bacterium]
MSEKRRLFNKISYVLCVCLLLAFCSFLSACSDDDAFNDATRASILVTHNVEARTMGSDVKKVSYYCYNRQGYRTFGPANLVKAQQILLQAVPVESVSISMTYYNNDNKVIGFYSQPVTLKIGEVYEINDPAWEDIDAISNLNRLRILQKDYRIHTLDSISMATIAEFTDTALGTGKKYLQIFSDNCEWTSSNSAVISNVEENGDEEVSTLGKKEFDGNSAGNAVITARFYNYSDTADIEVTDAMITGLAFDETSLVLPVSLDYCINSVTASWSDGKTSCVDLNSTWSSGDNDIVSGYYGFIVPKKASSDDSEEDIAPSEVSITASVNCGGENFADTCMVTVVTGTLTGIGIDADSDTCAVGESVAYRVLGTYTRKGYSSADYELDRYAYTLSESEDGVISAEDGFITGLRAGSTVLKAVLDANSNFTDSMEFTVTEAAEE